MMYFMMRLALCGCLIIKLIGSTVACRAAKSPGDGMNLAKKQPEIVSGQVLFPQGVRLPANAIMNVQVEDVSRADASSKVMARQKIPAADLELADPIVIAFSLPVEVEDERASYVVRAHVSCSGRDEVEVGDYVSNESYPVLTHGHGRRVNVRVYLVE